MSIASLYLCHMLVWSCGAKGHCCFPMNLISSEYSGSLHAPSFDTKACGGWHGSHFWKVNVHSRSLVSVTYDLDMSQGYPENEHPMSLLSPVIFFFAGCICFVALLMLKSEHCRSSLWGPLQRSVSAFALKNA